MKAGVLDTNVLLRFFLQDDPKLSPAATAFFQKAEEEEMELWLEAAIVAEVTFVMSKVYRRPRAVIADALLDFLQYPFIAIPNREVVNDALLRYRNHGVEFPDALVAALAAEKKVPAVTFDRDLDKFKDIARYEPKA
jgi:predicted nucleic acid-binding protein